MQVTYFILVDNGCRRGTVWPARFHPKHANRGVKKKFHVSAAQAKKNKMQMQIVYRGRELIQSCWTTSPLLAPTHDLARMILIVNSIVRDTNRDDDAMHYALWGVLDELILLHNKLAKVSIFSLTEKTSTRETAKELISLLPSFKKRLDQRDFDFALMQKKRRRILFKLYVLGTFMNVEVLLDNLLLFNFYLFVVLLLRFQISFNGDMQIPIVVQIGDLVFPLCLWMWVLN